MNNQGSSGGIFSLLFKVFGGLWVLWTAFTVLLGLAGLVAVLYFGYTAIRWMQAETRQAEQSIVIPTDAGTTDQ